MTVYDTVELAGIFFFSPITRLFHNIFFYKDHLPKEIGELSFRQVVLRIKLRKDAIAVALRDRVYVYHLADLSLRDKIYTADNPHGLLCLSTQIQNMVLACPSVSLGHVRVELYGLRKTQVRRSQKKCVLNFYKGSMTVSLLYFSRYFFRYVFP